MFVLCFPLSTVFSLYPLQSERVLVALTYVTTWPFPFQLPCPAAYHEVKKRAGFSCMFVPKFPSVTSFYYLLQNEKGLVLTYSRAFLSLRDVLLLIAR